MTHHSHPGTQPPLGQTLRVEQLVDGFRMQLVSPAGVVQQSISRLDCALMVGRLVSDWSRGKMLRIRAKDYERGVQA